jgi:ribosomal protein S18 acetylase RimI-like enzyme
VGDTRSPWAEDLRDGEAGVRMLAVPPGHQGGGVGRALVEACIELARSEAKRALFLHSTPWMEAAHHLYQRLGFRRVPERDWVPIPEVPLVAFSLDLSGGQAGPRG